VHSAEGWRAVLEPVVGGIVKRLYFRGDAAFANPEMYEFLEAEGMRYTIRLPANRVLQKKIGHLLKRPLGRPPQEVRRYYASFSYQAQSWNKPRRVVAKVEWHPGELYPRVGFIVTNLARPAERIVAFYNQRGTAEQCIKEGKGAIKWTRLSCRTFAANAVRLQLHALAYNLGNFMRTLAMPKAAEPWSLTSLREKLIKIGAKVVRHGRYVTFQMAEVAVSRQMFSEIISLIARLRAPQRQHEWEIGSDATDHDGRGAPDEGKAPSPAAARPSCSPFWLPKGRLRSNFVPQRLGERGNCARRVGHSGNIGSMWSREVETNEREPSREFRAPRRVEVCSIASTWRPSSACDRALIALLIPHSPDDAAILSALVTIEG
jgi:hypothetical protein